MDIIPAIDIIDGQCVRLTQGDYAQMKVYYKDPLDAALQFQDAGIKRLHMVDLDGAKSKHIVNHGVLERVASHTSLTIDFGGGIKSDDDIKTAFDSGAGLVTVGSIAVSNPELMHKWIADYSADRLILGADVRYGKISVNGWKEESSVSLDDFLETYAKVGINNVLCTDISRDGMLQGASTQLYKSVLAKFPTLYLIASGGVGSKADLDALKEAGLPAAIVGKAFYEKRITLDELSSFK